MRDQLISLAKSYLPPEVREWVVDKQKRYRLQWPRVGSVDFGSFRRVTPISPIFAIDRGFPIERYYIEQFLEANKADIRGRTLELGDPAYTKKFGGARVTQPDVLHVVEGNPQATIVADFSDGAEHVESDSFDCMIFTQSLQMIYDMRKALRTIHRIMKPGGVLLMTSHGISKIGRRLGRDDWGEYWHITTQSAEKLFAETFPGADTTVRSYGNVMTACCALHGLASEELSRTELDHHDPDFEVIVTARVQKR